MKEAAKRELPLEESAEVQQRWFRGLTEEEASKDALLKEWFDGSFHQQRRVVRRGATLAALGGKVALLYF